jgi:hypothetical protein
MILINAPSSSLRGAQRRSNPAPAVKAAKNQMRNNEIGRWFNRYVIAFVTASLDCFVAALLAMTAWEGRGL